MNPLTKRIYDKHVDRILKPKAYYDIHNLRIPSHRKEIPEMQASEAKLFAAGVLDVCKKLNIRAKVAANFNKDGE